MLRGKPRMEVNSMKRFQKLCLAGLFPLLVSFNLSCLFSVSDVFAVEPTAVVKVTIQEVHTDYDCDACCVGMPCDFWPKVVIDTEWFGSDTMNISDENTIHPNWVFTSKEIPLSRGSVPVHIQIYDSDYTTGDDIVKITPEYYDPDATRWPFLDLTVNLSPCLVQGEFYVGSTYGGTAKCNTTLESTGIAGTGVNEWAQIKFKIEVLEYGVKCLHSPIWPKPGQNVTINAQATVPSDSIEIWVNDQTNPAYIGSGTTTSYNTVVTGPQFSYGCRVLNKGQTRGWTGWRTVAVGDDQSNNQDNAFPVFYTGDRANAIDVVFHPALNDYQSADSLAFQEDVYDMIWNSFLSEDIFLRNQYIFNFWISRNFGEVVEYTDPETKIPCSNLSSTPPHQGPWSDLSVVLHTYFCRDDFFNSSFDNFATVGVTPNPLHAQDQYRTILHEGGHGIFGLADEYEKDGGYWEASPYANVYMSQERCEKDALTVPGASSTCREIHDTVNNRIWYTSDPAPDDLMNNAGTLQPLDLRRINWKFYQCRHFGDC
jgi:hypothetical protein